MNYRDCWHICKFADKNFTYIEVPKAGCTTIKHQMSMYFKEKLSSPPVKPTAELTKYMGYSRGPLPLDHNSFVFTVVRDPISRFISGLNMHAKNGHKFLPSVVIEEYQKNPGNPNWFLPFLNTGDLLMICNETHMTPLEYCIGNYLPNLNYVCSIENISLLEIKLNNLCGTKINFKHENKSSISYQATLNQNQLHALVNNHGLQKSYDLINLLNKNHCDVKKYDPSYWLISAERREDYYA